MNILNWLYKNKYGLLTGTVIGNITWAVQPKWSQGRQLIQHDFLYHETFLLVAFMYSIFIFGFYLWDKYSSKKEARKK